MPHRQFLTTGWRGKHPLATFTKALSQLEPAAPDVANQFLVCRLLSHMILARTYHEDADHAALEQQLEALRELTAAVEITKREVARLTVPAEASR
jgi:hypothetical protein